MEDNLNSISVYCIALHQRTCDTEIGKSSSHRQSNSFYNLNDHDQQVPLKNSLKIHSCKPHPVTFWLPGKQVTAQEVLPNMMMQYAIYLPISYSVKHKPKCIIKETPHFIQVVLQLNVMLICSPAKMIECWIKFNIFIYFLLLKLK